MLSNRDYITVICPHCGTTFRKTIGWLKDTGTIQCRCGAFSTANLNDVMQIAANAVPGSSPKLNLQKLPT